MVTKKAKNPAAGLAAAVILTCYLVQTTDSLRLRKTQRRLTHRETDFAPSAEVQEGIIVFGNVFEVPDENKKLSTSVDDETDYQADFAGWSQQVGIDEASKDKWNRLGTSLHCFGDHMKFRLLSPGASQLAVEQAHEPPIPLSMVPPRCGYRMHGNSKAFVMMAPYDGCNMIQQSGNYMLPLLWQGRPLSLLCPKHVRTTTPQWPPVPQVPPVPHQPYLDFYSHLFHAPAEPAKPVSQFPKFPLYPYPPYPYPPQTTAPPPATSLLKVPNPHVPHVPYFPLPYWPLFPELPPFLPYPIENYPEYPTSGPKTTSIPYTTAASPATTQAPPDTPTPLYPMDYMPLVPNDIWPQMFYTQG
ncbi:hypothetical protein AMECASPLE_000796 [Ameca splendens]|uniref:Uncharacterized protein n=1 Tax=Ameca splendens TaxID=208324 RepID=A0ABV0Z6Q4_9TELE